MCVVSREEEAIAVQDKNVIDFMNVDTCLWAERLSLGLDQFDGVTVAWHPCFLLVIQAALLTV